jgi:hypothetical protein
MHDLFASRDIDVEGSELDVLHGWSGHARLVILEANTDAARARLMRYMAGRGYIFARDVEQNLFFVRDAADAKLLAGVRLKARTAATTHPLGARETLEGMTGKVIRIARRR